MNNTADRHVDIIIPIYNALDDLRTCVESIIMHTDLVRHRLILIDDKSSDAEVGSYLRNLQIPGICIFENEKNVGFSGTVNKGLILSDENDVILLNSDTIVTARWVDKLLKCAYSDAGIATATPLSNNASICSVPHSNRNNPIPENMTLEEYAEEIERISMYKYLSIPLSVGFCMFIKRNVIAEVGLFDEEAFGQGYGEENDFCNRAAELGYRHVLCDTTFIYHRGTASFDEEVKQKLGKLHEGILEERYPQLNRRLEWYWANCQEGCVHKNVELFTALRLDGNKKNILYLVQADFRENCSNNIGGTQLHVKDLTNGLKNDYNIFVAARDGEILRVTAYIGANVIPLRFYIGEMPMFYVYRDVHLAELYKNLLLAFKIDLVHIHHTMGMTLELYYAAYRLDIPVYATLHDYYYICPTLRLLDANKESCVGYKDWKKCSACMKMTLGVYENVNYMQKWRDEHEKVLEICEKIIVPSHSAAQIILQYYPKIQDRLKVIAHGIDDLLFLKNQKKEEIYHKDIRVAFVGGICETKGSDVIYKMITNCRNGIRWYIFGGIDGADLLNLKQNNLIKTGWYKREELKSLLDNYEIDIVCILSTVAETYCYTLSEVVACGVPVIVTDIGALGERMHKMGCGWIVPQQAGAEVLLDLLGKIQKNRELLQEKKKVTNLYQVNTIDAMVDEYRGLYKKLKKQKTKKEKANFSCILDGYMAESYATVSIQTQNELMASKQMLEKELQVIYDSELFRVMKRVAAVVDTLKALRRRILRR